ncbi:hypothetical protein C8R43DRAFT_962999 [Mycena crocata]|nr:hypothetical protein C8R43DRAFT_962999 [Mycena crocata]
MFMLPTFCAFIWTATAMPIGGRVKRSPRQLYHHFGTGDSTEPVASGNKGSTAIQPVEVGPLLNQTVGQVVDEPASSFNETFKLELVWLAEFCQPADWQGKMTGKMAHQKMVWQNMAEYAGLANGV